MTFTFSRAAEARSPSRVSFVTRVTAGRGHCQKFCDRAVDVSDLALGVIARDVLINDGIAAGEADKTAEPLTFVGCCAIPSRAVIYPPASRGTFFLTVVHQRASILAE